MNVAFFTPTLERCGIADYSRFLLEHLRDEADVRVFACEGLTSAQDYARLGRSMNAAADVAHIQYEHGFFLANHAPAENLVAMIAEIRIPKVLTLHCPPLSHPLWRRVLDDPATSFLVHNRGHVDVLRSQGVCGRVEFVALPASPRATSAMSAAQFRQKHGLTQETILSIFGFTKRHKGYELAVQALRRLPTDTVLLIAGGPQDEADERALAQVLRDAADLGVSARIRVSGYITAAEVGAAFEASDVVLAPFTDMTASASIATALAWERPIVASDLRANAELGQTFSCLRLFESGNAADLARTIERVLSDAELRRFLCEGARRFRRECSYSALAQRTRDLYEQSLGAGRASSARSAPPAPDPIEVGPLGITVVLLTHNSERTLSSCLDSVKWADEIIALDADSTDGTRRILAAYGATIRPQPRDLIQAHRGNFDVARNVGFDLARTDWILVVDSDEEIPTPLRDEIRAATRRSAEVAYSIPRVNLFWNRPTAVLGRDFQLRLFPRGKARYEGCHLDARPVVTCPVEHLTQPLVHHQGGSLLQLIGKLHRRTSQRARVLHADQVAERERILSLFYWTFRYHHRELGASAEGLRGVALSCLFAAYPTLTQCKLRLLDARGALRFAQDRRS